MPNGWMDGIVGPHSRPSCIQLSRFDSCRQGKMAVDFFEAATFHATVGGSVSSSSLLMVVVVAIVAIAIR
jgi:hypothetical protein